MSGRDRFNELDRIRIADAVFHALLRRIGDHKSMKGREGGYLCIADLTGLPLLLLTMGIMPRDMAARYLRNALEKAPRLGLTGQWAGHTLSRQSRDKDRERWIGAALGKTLIISFSGLPEDGDEFFVVLLLVAFGDLSTKNAHRYLRKNTYYKKARNLIDDFEPKK